MFVTVTCFEQARQRQDIRNSISYSVHSQYTPTSFPSKQPRARRKMLDIGKEEATKAKCYFTHSTLPQYIDDSQPPTKRKPFSSILAQPYSHSVSLEYLENLSCNSTTTRDVYPVCEIGLTFFSARCISTAGRSRKITKCD